MTPEETSLARLLVALPGWRWAPGMLVCVPGDRGHVTAVLDGDEGVTVYVCFDEETRSCRFDEEIGLLLPDLTHMSTAGILLGMLPRRHLSARDWDVYEVTVYDCPPLPDAVVHSGPHGTAKWWTVSGGSLGVAVARALVAIGRCA